MFSLIENHDVGAVNHEKELSEYKNSLLASVSHELRTPLNANINFIGSALEDSQVPEESKKNYLMPALRSAKYLLTVVDDILDLSQI